MTCGSKNLIYVVIYSACKEECLDVTGTGDSKLRDRVRIYWQHIRQPENEKLKVEKHLKTWGKETSQHCCFYNCVQMTQIFDGNLKNTL